ncbi:MAG: hypothetical protein J6Y02_01055 [Pseudobutyrivibrio sp.]|nr:hypothetical protein [Pseudobutyrivibrio sp.]
MSEKEKKEQVATSPYVMKRPPFAGRYYIFGGKKYLFTHRHPYEQKYWSDDVRDGSGNFGAWIPTEKLKPAD